MAKGADKNKKSAASLFFEALGKGFKEIGVTFVEGDIKTKLSYIIFGLGPILRGQILIGIALLLCEVLFFYFMAGFGWQYLSKFSTLGTVATKKVGRKTVYGDNSFLILLFGGMTVMLLGLVGEYLARILAEAKQRPLYIIRESNYGESDRKAG